MLRRTHAAGFKNACYDGKPFFSADHPVEKKKVSNLGTKKLSMEAYKAGRTAIMSLVGDKGKSLGLVPDLQVVSPANEEMGRQILEAEFINGSSNVYKGTAKLLGGAGTGLTGGRMVSPVHPGGH